MTHRKRVRSALDGELRSTHEIAERAGVLVQIAAPLLRRLQRDGEAEYVQGADGQSLWRASSGERNASGSGERPGG